jgi:NAD(P)-dependent dehydrogenase (short-subunit alcohol dehydrogenase family)
MTAPTWRGLDGRVAIVTGAGSGLGRAHAIALAAAGARVVVNDIGVLADDRTPAADSVVAEIRAAGGLAVADQNSVSTVEGGRAIVDTAVDAFGTVDVLVNNAGILVDSPFAIMEPETWTRVIDVHLNGAFAVTQPAWRVMAEKGYGRIIFTTSASGIFGNSGHANYGAAKMGVLGLCRMLAVEGAPLGIRSNAVAPMAWTPMSQGKGSRRRAADVLGDLFARLDPAFVSPLVVWLASEGCSVTGEAYSVGGGRIARIFIGETSGRTDPAAGVADIERDLDEIRSTASFSVPGSMGDELALFGEALLGDAAEKPPEQ